MIISERQAKTNILMFGLRKTNKIALVRASNGDSGAADIVASCSKQALKNKGIFTAESYMVFNGVIFPERRDLIFWVPDLITLDSGQSICLDGEHPPIKEALANV